MSIRRLERAVSPSRSISGVDGLRLGNLLLRKNITKKGAENA